MNNKGQFAILSVIFSLIIFLVFWAMFFGQWLADAGENYIVTNEVVGLGAFLMSNLNLWVLIGVLLGVLGAVYIGGKN